jgi:hypothetical protein
MLQKYNRTDPPDINAKTRPREKYPLGDAFATIYQKTLRGGEVPQLTKQLSSTQPVPKGCSSTLSEDRHSVLQRSM